jgi:two-component system chemotaxis sensor kinase CheA
MTAMSDFRGLEDLLRDFLAEAAETLSTLDNKLVELERAPGDRGLVNDIFRRFHTIKGGAGFLNATELVRLCHHTENLLGKLRNGELAVSAEILDVILAATSSLRVMFGELESGLQPAPADQRLIARLQQTAAGRFRAPHAQPDMPPDGEPPRPDGRRAAPDWTRLYQAVSGKPAPTGSVAPPAARSAGDSLWGRRASDRPGSGEGGGRREGDKAGDASIRVETARLDQLLDLAGEIGLTTTRLASLRAELLAGATDGAGLRSLDAALSQLDSLANDLQGAVMKTRMQPIGRLFRKYPRIVRDLARGLSKTIELELAGEDTEIDKTMIEDLADPLLHLIRNAVDHGIESAAGRRAAGKPECGRVRLAARQEGDHIVITVTDDGRGMDVRELRANAIRNGVITDQQARHMDERSSLDLVFAPGFSTARKVSDVSGRGVGMDVVRTNVRKLDGTIEVRSDPGKGTTVVICLPLTLAILPVLLVRLGDQPFAIPQSLVREIVPIEPTAVQEVGGRAAMVVRGEVRALLPLANLLGREHRGAPRFGVVMNGAGAAPVLAVDEIAGHGNAVVKPIQDFRPEGVAGVTTLPNGRIVLILDMKELIGDGGFRAVPRSAIVPAMARAA